MMMLLKIKNYLNDNIYHYRFIDKKSEQQGIGSDTCERTAINKSISEFLELKFAQKYKKKLTTGIAVHFDQDEAFEKSKLELIERHYFLYSWFSNRNPQWLEEIQMGPDFKMRLGVIAESNQVILVSGLLLSTKNEIGFMVLLAAETSYQDAKNKLIIDSHRMITLIKRSDLSLLRSIDFLSHPLGNSLKFLTPTEENFRIREKYLKVSHHPLQIKKHDFKTMFDSITLHSEKRFAAITSCRELMAFFKGATPYEIIKCLKTLPERSLHPIG